ncbi:MAG: hypothetical protein ACEY3D_06580 [Rickettsia sp.]
MNTKSSLQAVLLRRSVLPLSPRGKAGVVAWLVLCHSRVGGNPS